MGQSVPVSALHRQQTRRSHGRKLWSRVDDIAETCGKPMTVERFMNGRLPCEGSLALLPSCAGLSLSRRRGKIFLSSSTVSIHMRRHRKLGDVGVRTACSADSESQGDDSRRECPEIWHFEKPRIAASDTVRSGLPLVLARALYCRKNVLR